MATPYVGNDDFRGYLNYLAQQGNAQARDALNFTGNDGGIDESAWANFYGGPGGDVQGEIRRRNEGRNFVDSAFNNWYGGGNTSASDYDPAAVAAFDQSIGNINSGLGRLPGQLDVGRKNIEQEYQTALQKLQLGKNRAQESYDTTKLQSGQDYVGAKNQIGSNVGNNINSLLRLLGSRGAGGSSAYLFNAPQAAARQGNLQRGEVGQAFGRNTGALDTNWGNYQTDYENTVGDVGNQRANQRRELEGGINTNRASLLQSLAQLTTQRGIASGQGAEGAVAAAQPYIGQANNYLRSADRLGLNVQPFNYNVQAYQAPNLEQYTSSPMQAPQPGQNAQQQNFNPFLSLLLGRDKDKRQQLGY